MEITVSPLFGESGRAFRALRKRDPAKNLAQRWQKLCAARPELEARLGFVQHVIDVGWAVVAVPEDTVAYTVGLNYRCGQKELLISAPYLDLGAQKRLLNQLGRRVVEGERFVAGQRLTIDGERVVLQAYQNDTFNRFPCGYLARFEELFEDRLHREGGTLPVLWAVLDKPLRARA